MNRACLLLLAAALAGCSQPGGERVEIAFAATVAGKPFACAAADDAFTGEELRLYVHDVELVDAAGRSVPVALDADGVWQDGSVALLDFEDGSASCRDGTAAVRTKVVGTAPAGTWTGLRFRIGVPFAANHGDPAVADPPLNLGRMNWGWRAGYKFIRFEGRTPAGRKVNLHLGSTGCEGTIGDIRSCARPNRAAVALDGFAPATDTVVLDLDPVVAALSRAGGDGACMAEPDDPDCLALFPVFGLDASGAAAATPEFVRSRRDASGG